MLDPDAASACATVKLPDMMPGLYRVVSWDTLAGRPVGEAVLEHRGGPLTLRTAAFAADLAVAVTRA
jgi:hypothetical protein